MKALYPVWLLLALSEPVFLASKRHGVVIHLKPGQQHYGGR